MVATTANRSDARWCWLSGSVRWAFYLSLLGVIPLLIVRWFDGRLVTLARDGLLVSFAIAVSALMIGSRVGFAAAMKHQATANWDQLFGSVCHLLCLWLWLAVAANDTISWMCIAVVTCTELICWSVPAIGLVADRRRLRRPAAEVLLTSIPEMELAVAGANSVRAVERSETHVVEQMVGRSDTATSETELEEEGLPDSITQQLTRSVDDRGEEIINGVIREKLESGQRTIISHVVFQPPLRTTPVVEAHVVDGQDGQVKRIRSEAFGIRMETRLDAVAQDGDSVLIEFVVRTDSEETSLS